MFTRQLIEEIKNKLYLLGKKDSLFDLVKDVGNDAYFSIVVDGENKRVSVQKFIDIVAEAISESKVGISLEFGDSILEGVSLKTLTEALNAIYVVDEDSIVANSVYRTVILPPNMDEHNSCKLTQDMLLTTNTKYVIKYNYDVVENITMPANCILSVDGGKLFSSSGMKTITGVRNTFPDNGDYTLFETILPDEVCVDLDSITLTNFSYASEGGDIDPSKIPSQSIDTTKLEDGSVTEPKLANSAVTSNKIAPNAVVPGKIDVSSLNTEDLNLNGASEVEFANRVYNATTPNGMGYKILRTGAGLTFANQVTDENTIYEIRNDFDLDDSEYENPIALHSGCVLRFNGGSITNGALTGTVSIENMPADFLDSVHCGRLNITTMRHLSLGDTSDLFDNYTKGIVANRHEQNIVGSAYYYDITGRNTLYYMTSSTYPVARVCFYGEDLDFISYSDWVTSTVNSISVPSGAKYATFVLLFQISQIPNIETLLKDISFSFLDAPRTFITDEMRFGGAIPDSFSVKLNDVTKTYIRPSQGDYRLTNDDEYSSICIPYSVFKNYDYIAVQAGDHLHNESDESDPATSKATRVYILKEEPKTNGQAVVYSEYYNDNFSIDTGFIYNSSQVVTGTHPSVKLDINIPNDAKYIVVLNSTGGNNNTPKSITLKRSETYLGDVDDSNVGAVASSNRNTNQYSHKFIHWNIGNFSNGNTPYTSILDQATYNRRIAGYNDFFSTYAADSHILFNEYNEIIARISGQNINTTSVLSLTSLAARAGLPRSTSSGYNKLASFFKEGLRAFRYGVFESLKGLANNNGTLEYGLGYTISSYNIGGTYFRVMGLHAPNAVGSASIHNALYDEILDIVADYPNIIIVGDFNISSSANFSKFTDAGFHVLNQEAAGEGNPTAPTHYKASDDTYSTLDWVLYKLSGLTISDFHVYQTEAVDSNDVLLSDHFPVGFTVSRSAQSGVTKNVGNYRYNVHGNIPEWYNGEEWFSFNTNGETPTAIAASSDLDSFVEVGQYYCNSGEKAATITHKPADFVDNGFQLWVRPMAGDGSARVIQFLKGSYTNAPVYMRRSQNDQTFALGWEKMDCYTVGTQNSSTTYTTTNYLYGDSTNRAALTTSSIGVGHRYFDTTLGKPVYWQGTKWVYADGTDVS